MKRFHAVCLMSGCAAALLISASCDNPAPPKTRLPLDQVGGNARVSGKVTFTGTPPERKIIENKPCHPGAGPIVDETVIVGSAGGLANVFVFIEGLPATRNSGRPELLLDQVNCQYTPHVVGLAAGQTLRVRSSDPCVHNVHLSPTKNPSANFTMNRAGESSTITFENAEFIKTVCDVHPWMGAWVGVFENPFFARTSEDGTFEITGLPAGTYEISAWHELYGRLPDQSVTLAEDRPAVVDFAYSPPVKQ